MLSPGDDNLVECYRCRGKFPVEGWKIAKSKRYVGVCAGCDNAVPLTPINIAIGAPFYVCSQCGNILAIRVASRIIQPTTILTFDWAKNMHARAERLAGSAYRVARVSTQAEHLIVLMLLQYAKEEEPFIYGSKEDNHALLCMDDEQYVGYIRWSMGEERNDPVLHQIFIIKARQRQGIGTMLLCHWAENFAFPFVEKFGVESPNHKSFGALVKLGYAERDGERGMKGIRCYFVSGM